MPEKKLTDNVPGAYRCTACGATAERDQLTVKKSLFQNFGRNGKWLRSRVVAWLCPACREADSDWNAPDQKGQRPKKDDA